MKTFQDPKILTEIQDRIARLPAEAPRQWGKMSAHQMLCHLADSKRGVMGAKPLAYPGTLLQRMVIKTVALRFPIPWPKGIPTRPEMDQMAGGTKPVEFAKDKAALLELIERMVSPNRDFQFVAHPMFGAMSD